mmetsp:Transcript_75623/g.231456  ORF Transcript_75623/g.231456 Transcript_75623/m.231456 type:complete len:265 (+) Transcript_75623:298-1092(+)
MTSTRIIFVDPDVPPPMHVGRRTAPKRRKQHTDKQHCHFRVLRWVSKAFPNCFSPPAVYSTVFRTFFSMSSNISPCASTKMAISWNICAKSWMLCSRRRMSWCLSRMRSTSSKIMAWAPAIRRMTTCDDVWPASIISDTSSGVASGHRSCISRACRCTSTCLKSTWAFWKSTSSCWCFLAMACCMFCRMRRSAELGFALSSASARAFSASRPRFDSVMCFVVSSAKRASSSETAFCLSWVVAFSTSSSFWSMTCTFSRPRLNVL